MRKGYMRQYFDIKVFRTKYCLVRQSFNGICKANSSSVVVNQQNKSGPQNKRIHGNSYRYVNASLNFLDPPNMFSSKNNVLLGLLS